MRPFVPGAGFGLLWIGGASANQQALTIRTP